MNNAQERRQLPLFTFLAAVAFVACLSPSVSAASEDDDPSARRDATLEWYGGDWTPEYRRYVLDVADQERRRHLAKAAKAGEGPTAAWVNLGPTRAQAVQNGAPIPGAQDSGRASSIVVHPNDPRTIYLATSGGGVWKTVDAGATWLPITETVGSLSVGSLEMDPLDPLTLYLGLGDPYYGFGIGVLKTTDGGATWSQP